MAGEFSRRGDPAGTDRPLVTPSGVVGLALGRTATERDVPTGAIAEAIGRGLDVPADSCPTVSRSWRPLRANP